MIVAQAGFYFWSLCSIAQEAYLTKREVRLEEEKSGIFFGGKKKWWYFLSLTYFLKRKVHNVEMLEFLLILENPLGTDRPPYTWSFKIYMVSSKMPERNITRRFSFHRCHESCESYWELGVLLGVITWKDSNSPVFCYKSVITSINPVCPSAITLVKR